MVRQMIDCKHCNTAHTIAEGCPSVESDCSVIESKRETVMNIYEVTDESVDANPNPVVHVKAENMATAVKRALAEFNQTHQYPRRRMTVQLLCSLSECLEIHGS